MKRRKHNREQPTELPWWIAPTIAAVTIGGVTSALAHLARTRAVSSSPTPDVPITPPSPRTPSTAPRLIATPPVMSYASPPHATLAAPPSGPAALFSGLSERDYLRAVEAAFLAGQVPASQRAWHPVHTQSGAMTGTFFVQGLPLALGTDAAMFHPAIPVTMAQRIADHLGASLPTRRMVDLIHAQATAHVPFQSFASNRSSPATLVTSSQGIEARRAGRSGLISDLAKDYVLSNQRRHDPRRITIYGAWQTAGGTPVQPLATPHALTYYDYSQHARMVRRDVLVNGSSMSLETALSNPTTAGLFSSEGVITGPMMRYPTA